MDICHYFEEKGKGKGDWGVGIGRSVNQLIRDGVRSRGESKEWPSLPNKKRSRIGEWANKPAILNSFCERSIKPAGRVGGGLKI
jgi:hypothetical protein